MPKPTTYVTSKLNDLLQLWRSKTTKQSAHCSGAESNPEGTKCPLITELPDHVLCLALRQIDNVGWKTENCWVNSRFHHLLWIHSESTWVANKTIDLVTRSKIKQNGEMSYKAQFRQRDDPLPYSLSKRMFAFHFPVLFENILPRFAHITALRVHLDKDTTDFRSGAQLLRTFRRLVVTEENQSNNHRIQLKEICITQSVTSLSSYRDSTDGLWTNLTWFLEKYDKSLRCLTGNAVKRSLFRLLSTWKGPRKWKCDQLEQLEVAAMLYFHSLHDTNHISSNRLKELMELLVQNKHSLKHLVLRLNLGGTVQNPKAVEMNQRIALTELAEFLMVLPAKADFVRLEIQSSLSFKEEVVRHALNRPFKANCLSSVRELFITGCFTAHYEEDTPKDSTQLTLSPLYLALIEFATNLEALHLHFEVPKMTKDVFTYLKEIAELVDSQRNQSAVIHFHISSLTRKKFKKEVKSLFKDRGVILEELCIENSSQNEQNTFLWRVNDHASILLSVYGLHEANPIYEFTEHSVMFGVGSDWDATPENDLDLILGHTND